MSKRKLIIGLPVYNGQKYLGRAIESHLSQSFGDFDLVISDNGSTDATPEICADYASVLYLNSPDQCQGGTAFWRHRHLGIDGLPNREDLAKHSVDSDDFYKQIEHDWKVKELWEQTDFVPMKWNRFITYPTSFFHSRFPFEAFGSGPKDGRLIWICFYDIVKDLAKREN